MFQFILMISPITWSLLIVLCVIGFFIWRTAKIDTTSTDKKTTNGYSNTTADENMDLLPLAPGPRSYPIIGSMHLLGKYEVPYQAFGELAKTYGPIIKMDLGSVPSLIVNGQENIREILFTKGTHFDSRPNFQRYHHLFSGDKENSLAFCNWSNLQKSRREMLRPHSFPTSFSRRFQELDQIILNEIPEIINHFQPNTNGENIVNLKEVVLKSCANIFIDYFATKKFQWSNPKFEKLLSNYDEVFYEVNQGYAADFLPFLLPFHAQSFAKMTKCTHDIRDFVVENIIEKRFEQYSENNTPDVDYVNALIESVKSNETNSMDWDTALFALEDIIGGHSAVGNFLIKVLAFLVENPEAQQKMQQEIDECLRNKLNDTYIPNRTPEVDIFRSEHEDAYVQTDIEKLELETRIVETDVVVVVDNYKLKDTTTSLSTIAAVSDHDKQTDGSINNDRISIKDRNSMPYTEAVILEGIRLIASPIVPHVANQDSSVGGYRVPKDTLIFLNNYELNMSEKLWDEPQAFRPERFIKNGKVQKPDYFLPFGGGKRSCMGYKMVQLIGFSVLSNIIQSFTLKPHHTIFKIPIGNLALKPNIPVNFTFEKRRT